MITDSQNHELKQIAENESESNENSTFPRLNSNAIRVAMEEKNPNIDTLPLNSTVIAAYTRPFLQLKHFFLA